MDLGRERVMDGGKEGEGNGIGEGEEGDRWRK